MRYIKIRMNIIEKNGNEDAIYKITSKKQMKKIIMVSSKILTTPHTPKDFSWHEY